MKQFIERPNHNLHTLDIMCSQLSPYMTNFEVDQVVQFLDTVSKSKLEKNWTVDDAATQLKIMFGSDRYEELKRSWSMKNQNILKDFGQKKYLNKNNNKYYDNIPIEDDSLNYIEIYL